MKSCFNEQNKEEQIDDEKTLSKYSYFDQDYPK